MPINPTIKNSCITLCILMNVIEALELKSHSHKQLPSLDKEVARWKSGSADFLDSWKCYIHVLLGFAWYIRICFQMLHTFGLVRTYQANPSCPYCIIILYITYVYVAIYVLHGMDNCTIKVLEIHCLWGDTI